MPVKLELNPGAEFGAWTVLTMVREKGKNTRVLCRCHCGTERAVLLHNLRRGASKNCGCVIAAKTAQRNRKHGLARRGRNARLYRCWAGMIARCTNPNAPLFHNYGGRGINVCEAWRDFSHFMKWAMSTGYDDELTIERVKVGGNYEPSNCRWVPKREQYWNRTDSRLLTAFGETKSMPLWVRDARCKVTYGTLRSRVLADRWSDEDAITTPKCYAGRRLSVPKGGR